MSELSPLHGTSFYDKELLSKKIQHFSFDPPEQLKEFSPTKKTSPAPHNRMMAALVEGDGHIGPLSTPINEDKAKEELEASLSEGKVKGTDAALSLLLGAPLMSFLQGKPLA